MPLGPWAIAQRSLRIQIVFSSLPQYHLLDGVMDKTLTFKAKEPGFKSRLRHRNSFKESKFPFLIEDISELECWTLIRHLVIYESLSIPKKIWNGKLSVPKKNWNGKWFIEYIGQYLIPTDDSHGVYPVPERLWRSSKMREKDPLTTKMTPKQKAIPKTAWAKARGQKDQLSLYLDI